MSHDLLKNPLPEPWTFGVTKDGRIFFVNDEKKVTTWLHPETGIPMTTGYFSLPSLPKGWQKGFLNDGTAYYINHNKQVTTLHHPKVILSDEEPKSPAFIPKKRSSSFRETITRPLIRLSSLQEKNVFSARRHHFNERKNTVRRDTKVAPSKKGWLFKRDHTGGVKVWRKRWFVLSNFCLLYYKDEKENEALGSIVLPSYKVSTINPDNNFKRKYGFKIEHAGMRSYFLCAESYGDMAKWVAELSKACSFVAEHSTTKEKSEVNSHPTSSEQSISEAKSESTNFQTKQTAPEAEISMKEKKVKKLSVEDEVFAYKDTERFSSTSSTTSTTASLTKFSQNLPKQNDSSSNMSKDSYDLNTYTSFTHTLPKYSVSSNNQAGFVPRKSTQEPDKTHSNTLPLRKVKVDSPISIESSSENDRNKTNKSFSHAPVIKNDPSNAVLGSNYEVKQVDVFGKKGQYRAFAISRSFSTAESTTCNRPIAQKKEKNMNESPQNAHQIQHDPVIEAVHVPSSSKESPIVDSTPASPHSSVDTLTAAMLSRASRSTTQQMNLSRTKSASERLLNRSHHDLRSTQDPIEVKKMQQQINKHRIRSLTGDYYRSGPHANGVNRPQVATDIRSAMKYNRMPKVLRRAKNGQQHGDTSSRSSLSDFHNDFGSYRSESEATNEKTDYSSTSDEPVSPPFVEIDIEPEDVQIDLDLTNQLFIPNKVEIPDRLMEYEDVELSPEQERLKQKKIRAIESLLAKSGQTAFKPPVHLAAALAAEAGTVARAVAHQAHQSKEFEPSYV